MPNWQFLVIRQFGGANQRRQLCARIKQTVEMEGLESVLPLVKYEVGRGSEYYLGLAVDVGAGAQFSDGLEIARHVLLHAGITNAKNPKMTYVVEPDKIQGLLRGGLECESFTMPITYETQREERPPDADELLSLADISELSEEHSRSTGANTLEQLLIWCSAVGEGDLRKLHQACELFGIDIEWGGAWSILRRLVLLGHLEFKTENGFRWGIIPPVVVAAANREDGYFLAGQRTPTLIDVIESDFRLSEELQVDGPRKLRIHDLDDDMCVIGLPRYNVRCIGPSSTRLSELLPNLSEWVNRLPVWEEKDYSRFETEVYRPDSDQFEELSSGSHLRQGLYRFSFQQKGRQKVVTNAFFDEQNKKFICGDFYGLRFLARCRTNYCRAIYLEDRLELLVPLADRWPMPYERALVLASGSLPMRMRSPADQIVLAYPGVTSELVKRLGALLELSVEEGPCTT